MTNLILGQDGVELILGIPVPAPATGESNTLADAGQNAHESLVASPAKVGDALQAKGLRAGDNVTLTDVPADNVVEVSVPLPDNVEGPASATDNAVPRYNGTTGKLLKDSVVTIDDSGNIATPGTVDGRDVAADGALLDGHVANTSNPHATTAAQVGADPVGSAAAVQANLDAHEADLANPHATTAALVGADPVGTAAAAVSSHEATYAHANLPTAAEKAALVGTGTPSGANPYVTNDDARMSDARVPTGAASGDLAGTYPSPSVPHVTLTNNPHGVTAGQVGAIPSSDKGNPNGVATLDGSGDIPIAQIPDSARPIVHEVADAAARIALGLGVNDEGHEAIQADDSSQWLWTGTAWVARATAGSGDVFGPASSSDHAVARYDGITGKVLLDSAVTVDDAGNIATAGTVDGRDVSTDGSKLDGIAAGAQPNQTINANVGLTGGGAGAVVDLAADIGVGASQVAAGNDARFPTTPEKAALVGTDGAPSGANPYVTDSDPRIPTSGENNALQGTFGAPGGANRYVTDTDPRMTDARVPTAHGATHEDGGSDEIGSATPAANAIVKADGIGKLPSTWLYVGAGASDVASGNDGRFPTTNQKGALVGTDGSPSGSNPYVTDSDPRLVVAASLVPGDTVEDVDASPGAAGISLAYSRADHKHDVLTAAPGNITPDAAASEGAADTLARSDHTHGIVAAAPGSVTPDATSFEGSASSFSRSDHRHAVSSFGTPGTIRPDDTAQQGSASLFTRSDHQHAIATDTPGAVTPGDVASEGASIAFARADHQHSVAAFAAPGTIEPDDAADAGSATSFSRSDHQHAIAAAAAGTIQPDDTSDEGTATSFSRSDHRHAITADTPTTINPGDVAAEGTATSFARSDHVHGIAKFWDPDRTVLVAKTAAGADATSIADAITLANAFTPTAAAPVAIFVAPGTYSTPPFTLPDYVSLIGLGGKEGVIISASTATAALCSANGGQRIEGLTFRDASGVGGVGIDVAGTTGTLLVKDCYIDDCETALRCVGAGRSINAEHCEVEDGVEGMLVDGAGARGRINSLAMTDFTTGLHIGSSGGIVTGTYLRIVDDSGFTTHVQVENASSVFALTNGVFREDKTDYNTSAEIAVQHSSVVPGDEAFQITAELHVGSEDRPRESAFGGGDSHTRGMAALTNTNLEAGTWADITAQLRDDDASSATLFPGVAAGNTFYIGGDSQFPGLKPEVTTALAIGTGALVLEYWNGTAWVAIEHLSCDSNAPYGQYAQAVFQRVNTEQIRFNTEAITGWATKSLNGITKYWVRFRITTAITTAPACDRIKLHTNRTEINADGVVEYFGAAEVQRQFVWARGLMWELVGFAQPNSDIPIATGFSIKGFENRWQNGNKDGSAATVQAVPGLDTSRPLIYEVGWTPEATDVGNVELQLDVVTLNAGNVLGALPYTRQLSQIITGPFTANTLYVTQFVFTTPDLQQNGSLALALYRDAGGGNLDDTFGADARHVWSRMLGRFWR